MRRGQHLRVPLEIANEMPAAEGISAQALSELDASNEGIGHAREQFALLEEIEDAKRPAYNQKCRTEESSAWLRWKEMP
jgi:hypothetical protein